MCSDDSRLMLSESMVSESHLGGRGTDASVALVPEDMRFNDVFANPALDVDMVFTAVTDYYGNPASNKVSGDFAMVNVNAASALTLKVSFLDRLDGNPVTVPPFSFTVAGLGRFEDEEGGEKSLTISGFDSYQLKDDSMVQADCEGNTCRLKSNFVGIRGLRDHAPPRMALSMSQSNMVNSATFLFPSVQEFYMTLEVGEGEGDRDFYFSGASSLTCSSRALCSSFSCPEFYVSKNESNKMYCEGSICTDADVEKCCMTETPEECESQPPAYFEEEDLAYANLGGQGPDSDKPPGIRIKHVFKDANGSIDLVVTNKTEYLPSMVNQSTMSGKLLVIDLAVNTSVELSFDFYRHGTQSHASIPAQFSLDILDLDMQSDGQAREEVTVENYTSYYLMSKNSSVKALRSGKGDTASTPITFRAKMPGNSADNPTDPMTQSREQLEKSAGLRFEKGTSHFSLTPRLKGGSRGGRNILFAGRASKDCPKKSAFCSAVTCPSGYHWRPNREKRRCAGDKCTADDVTTCCQPSEGSVCDSQRRLVFTRDSMFHNNLGGLGPDKLPMSMRIADVFPMAQGEKYEMRLSTLGEYHIDKSSPPNNGVIGGFLKIDVLAGTELNLDVRIITATGINEAKNFVLSVVNIDTGAQGTAVQTLSSSGFTYFNVSANSSLFVNESKKDGTTSASFTGTVHGNNFKIPSDVRGMESLFLNKAVSFVYKHVESFQLKLAVSKGFGYRSFLLAGATELACPAKQASCLRMVCPANTTLKVSAAGLSCAGPTCTEAADKDTCCNPVNLEDCAPEVSLTLSPANLLSSNLGGFGPDFSRRQLIKYTNVFPRSGRTIDLVISNTTEYAPYDPHDNGFHGTLGSISMIGSGSAEFEFRLFDRASGELMSITRPFIFSLVDLRAQLEDDSFFFVGKPEVMIPEAIGHAVTDLSHVVNSGTSFSTSSFGSRGLSPTGPWGLRVAHKRTSVAVRLNTSIFHMQVSFKGGKAAQRKVLFAGPTNLGCPARAYCSTLTCPEGLALIKEANETLCYGAACTAEDKDICCHYPQCKEEESLILKNVLRNNLGGKGPNPATDVANVETEAIVYGDVFPFSGRKINLVVSVRPGSQYFVHTAELNGLDGPFGSINFKAGTHVDLDFRFQDAVTNEPAQVNSFFFSLSGIDMQAHGATEEVTVWNYLWYKTTAPRTAIASVTDCGGGNVTFSALEAGLPEGSEASASHHNMALGGAVLNHTVSLLMPQLDSFHVTMRSRAGWAGRNVLFAGLSNIVCGKKSSCLAMDCGTGATLRPDAHLYVCQGELCYKERDFGICCLTVEDTEGPAAKVEGEEGASPDEDQYDGSVAE